MEKSFGAIIVDKDPRDFDLSQVGAAIPRPYIYRPDYSHLPVYDQSKIPACGSHAGTALKLVQEKASNPNFSPRYLWSEIKKIDGFPPSDGTNLYSILQTLRKKGVCDYPLVGNDTSLPLSTYTNFQSTPAIDANAEKNEVDNFATIFSPSFEQIKQAIYINGAVIILMRVGKNMYSDKNGITWDAGRLFPLSTTNFPMDSGHFVCAIGYDQKYIYFRNSWGVEWGLTGDGYFGENYIPFVNSIGTAIDKVNLPPVNKLKDIITSLQKFLVAEGYLVMPSGVAFGHMGDLTKSAVDKFQLNHP